MAHLRRASRQNGPGFPENRDGVRAPKAYDSTPIDAAASGQIVTDDWPTDVPITAAEVDILDVFLGDLLDAFLRPRH
jgi:hypothetical protein